MKMAEGKCRHWHILRKSILRVSVWCCQNAFAPAILSFVRSKRSYASLISHFSASQSSSSAIFCCRPSNLCPMPDWMKGGRGATYSFAFDAAPPSMNDPKKLMLKRAKRLLKEININSLSHKTLFSTSFNFFHVPSTLKSFESNQRYWEQKFCIKRKWLFLPKSLNTWSC